MKYWNDAFTEEEAAVYMHSYGEGAGSDTRKQLTKFINPGESVLDVGCGPGWNFDHFRDYGPSVKYKGIDYSERFIKVAKERNPRANYASGDARELEEENSSWDVVILQDILEHTNGYEVPVEEALRVAKKRIIITFWRMKEDLVTKINDDGDDTWGADYNQKEWEEYLDGLLYPWAYEESLPTDNRQHKFYIIEKEIGRA